MQSAIAAITAAFGSSPRPDRFYDCYCDGCCDNARALDTELAEDFDPKAISNDTWDWLCGVNVAGYFHLLPYLAAYTVAHPQELWEFVDYLHEERLDAMSLGQLRAVLAFVQTMHPRYAADLGNTTGDDWILPRIELLEVRIREFGQS